ncbi:hypothetical protein VAEKB19_3240010 [Vibrio aestuarianus]|nr:hypothetical protein VAEKB19_3240010 [Vibrio aestuarianus]
MILTSCFSVLLRDRELEGVDKGASTGGDFDFFHAVHGAVVAVSGIGLAEL